MKEYSSKQLFNRKNREQIIDAKEVFINDEEAIVVQKSLFYISQSIY